MSGGCSIPEARDYAYFFRGQIFHVLALVVLLPVAWALAAPALDAENQPWFLAAIGVAIVHQVYVWFGWRAQLGWGWFTRVFGRFDLAVWNALFFALLIARPVLVCALARVDSGSLALDGTLSVALGSALLLPAGYVGWSIRSYFGFARAAGADHFRTRYREMPLETRGAFCWTPNAMYALAFLGLWSIALIGRSQLALVAALFQHAYIWVHYLSVEKPDMELIYGRADLG